MVVRGLHLPDQMATFHCILQMIKCRKFKLYFEFFDEAGFTCYTRLLLSVISPFVLSKLCFDFLEKTQYKIIVC
uniref:Uncharacterized protein n=1 Tax=Arundo donax TaxID=35708 RepID=A0A0A9G0E9_ARUDO